MSPLRSRYDHDTPLEVIVPQRKMGSLANRFKFKVCFNHRNGGSILRTIETTGSLRLRMREVGCGDTREGLQIAYSVSSKLFWEIYCYNWRKRALTKTRAVNFAREL